MNWVLIIVLLTLGLCVIHGYCRGFLRIVYSLVAWLLALVFVSWSTPYISRFLMENTRVYERVEAHCEETIRQSAAEKAEEQVQQTELAGLGLDLPDSVLEGIMQKTSGAADEFLEESGIYTKLAGALADFVIEGISFVGALILAGLLLYIVSALLGIVSRIPVLKGVNRFLGTFAGAIQGLLLIWVAFYIIALCSTNQTGKVLISYINENPFLTFLYENNFVLTVILNIF